tara:strand:+ start:73 stop:567 length:495 start_codon:yes stop_codon:yes gene_type:complete
MTKFTTLLAALVASAAIIPATAQAADATVKVGALDCVVDGGGSFIFGSSRELSCTFAPFGDTNPPSETYVGSITKFGIDLGVTGTALLHWDVVAPADATYEAGQLAGDYLGASASASFAGGLGANVLVGGSQSSFALQPISVQAQEGVNVAAGIAALKLVSTGG